MVISIVGGINILLFVNSLGFFRADNSEVQVVSYYSVSD